MLSALPLKADIASLLRYVRLVPKGDIRSAAKRFARLRIIADGGNLEVRPRGAPLWSAARAVASAVATAAGSAVAPFGFGKVFAEPGCSGVFFVEYIERPQADVGDLFFTERDLGPDDIPERRIRGRHSRRRRHPGHQRQRRGDGSYNRYGLFAALSLRSSLRVPHNRVLP